MAYVSPTLVNHNKLVTTGSAIAKLGLEQWRINGNSSGQSTTTSSLGSTSFIKAIDNYYMTDTISRASCTMAQSAAFLARTVI
ncbi:hypothetical protein LPJ72_005397, partial [Coemansia sp. Benny D160-2]